MDSEHYLEISMLLAYFNVIKNWALCPFSGRGMKKFLLFFLSFVVGERWRLVSETVWENFPCFKAAPGRSIWLRNILLCAIILRM